MSIFVDYVQVMLCKHHVSNLVRRGINVRDSEFGVVPFDNSLDNLCIATILFEEKGETENNAHGII
jgi:hypothetical protein